MKSNSHTCLVCKNRQQEIFKYGDYEYFRCPNCRFVSTYPFPSTKKISDHYKKKSKLGNYALLKQYRDQYKLVYEDFANRLYKYSKAHSIKHKTILDVGCFTGVFLTIMKENGYDVYGIELQKEAVEIANKKLEGAVKQADIMKRDLFKKKFGVVSMQGLIEHVTNPVSLLGRTYDFLKPGGVIFIQTPNSSSLFARIMGKYWPPYSPVEHLHLFSNYSLQLALENNGFTNIIIQKHIKRLPVNYVYQNFKNFGPEFYKLLKPIEGVLNRIDITFPFYIGEMIVIAQKKI